MVQSSTEPCVVSIAGGLLGEKTVGVGSIDGNEKLGLIRVL